MNSGDKQLKRDSAFSYKCNCCTLCCRAYSIQVNPYEVLRLANNKKQSTTKFRKSSTVETKAGTILRRDKSGACTFLGDKGCAVHEDRPLVCRLYPLGRHTEKDGSEWFSTVVPQPGSLGEYGTSKTVEDYLNHQGAPHFIDVVERYKQLLLRAVPAIQKALEDDVGSEELSSQDIESILDIDACLSKHYEKTAKPIPENPEEKMELHITILSQLLS